MNYLQHENVWFSKPIYEEAEAKYYENLAKASVTPLAGEVAKTRQLLIDSRDNFKEPGAICPISFDTGSVKFLEKKVVEFGQKLEHVIKRLDELTLRVTAIEKSSSFISKPMHEINISSNVKSEQYDENDDDDVDLFGSDSDDEENETVSKIREERLAMYNAKKSKKPALIAKSNVILDVKPWDDETNMEVLEKAVRNIKTDGLLWGAAKLVPLAYGIHKLQISCVVEDEKVSIDWLQDEITAIEDFVQSVDIAAFNKI